MDSNCRRRNEEIKYTAIGRHDGGYAARIVSSILSGEGGHMDILEAKHITKVFPGVKALDSVDVTFRQGEVHCIMGENGAGKSTLIKCLTGVYTPEEGEVFIGGESALKNKKLFQKIAYVPQEIDLFMDMSVAENLFIPYERSGTHGLVHKSKVEERARPLLEKLDIGVSPESLVRDIPVSKQQLLQIARATALEGCDVLMLDEPTTSLTTKDTEKLFDIIHTLRNQNKAIIFISHKLDEIFEIGDVITVFCNGKKVSHAPLNQVDIPWVVKQMTGKSMDEAESYSPDHVGEEVILDVKDLTGDMFQNVSFCLRKGEILGFAGLVGAGRSEVMQGILGYLPVYEGSVTYYGSPWKLGDTSYSVRKGLLYIPEERRAQGILANLSVRENISVSALKELGGKFGLSKTKEQNLADKVIDDYDIKTPDIEKEIKFLSGGNQQKAIIGRSMSAKPRILIFDEPTKGIDIGTKTEIYRLMKKLAQQGIGIILISSELDEIKKCANRIICMNQGRVTGEFWAGTDKEAVLSSILGLDSKTEGEEVNE